MEKITYIMKTDQQNKIHKDYSQLWLILVDIKAMTGKFFNELIEIEDGSGDYTGAWANILIKSETINQAIEIVPLGLQELGFIINKVDKIENFETLVENNLIEEDVIQEAEWLLSSTYVFKITDRLFPYSDE